MFTGTPTARYTIDLETDLIQPGAFIPPPVAGATVISFPGQQVGTPQLQTCAQIAQGLIEAAKEPGVIVLAHNACFDLAVMAAHLPECAPAVWQLYEEGRVSCTKVRDKLIHIRRGTLTKQMTFKLSDLVSRWLNIDISVDKAGDQSWRKRYHELRGVSFDQWPADAVQYLLNDARLPELVYLAPQQGTGFEWVPDEQRQAKFDFALQWITAYGMIADPAAVAKLRQETLDEMAKYEKALWDGKLLKPKVGGFAKDTKIIKALVESDYAARGEEVPRTDPSAKFVNGQTKMDEETLSACTTPALRLLVSYMKEDKLLTSFIDPVLIPATTRPIHPSYDVLKETGRTSSFGGKAEDGSKMGCNIQQLPRKGGVRECFVPRPGYVFIDCDYSGIELCALAQVCYSGFGESRMRDMLIAGHDLHVVTAAAILGITVEDYNNRKKLAQVWLDKPGPHSARDQQAIATAREEMTLLKDTRQFAKVPNFGLPGGLGVATFILFAKGYGYDLDETKAQTIKDTWLSTYPEVMQYFAYVSSLCNNPDNCADITQLFTQRVRGRAGYTQICNTYFQGLAADGAKEAIWLAVRESLTDPASSLYGCYLVAFIHDEILMEAPAERAQAAAARLSELMIEGMKKFIPDVPVIAEPAIMERWYKEAEPTFDENGQLIAWTP